MLDLEAHGALQLGALRVTELLQHSSVLLKYLERDIENQNVNFYESIMNSGPTGQRDARMHSAEILYTEHGKSGVLDEPEQAVYAGVKQKGNGL